MTNRMKRSPNALLAVVVAATIALGMGAAVVPAQAAERHDDRRGPEHRDDREHRGYSGGYYGAPPVIYGSPCGYGGCPPPVVYGPGVGIVLPNIMLNIR